MSGSSPESFPKILRKAPTLQIFKWHFPVDPSIPDCASTSLDKREVLGFGFLPSSLKHIQAGISVLCPESLDYTEFMSCPPCELGLRWKCV